MPPYEWVVINYTLPREPSRARVSVWRRLKKIGALNMQQSMWILPLSGEHYEWMCGVRDEVARNGGEAYVMKTAVDDDSREVIVRRFNEARDEEYRELIEQCGDFFKEIDKETERRNFSFAEIEENEEELEKLKEWAGKIARRDCFGAKLAPEARAMLEKCGELLEGFCAAVYAYHEGIQGEAE